MSESNNADVAPTREEVIEAVKKELNSEKVELINYNIRPASDSPLGFLGDHLRITGKIKHNEEEKNFQHFAKLVPTKNPAQLEYAEKTRVFFKEIEMYKTLFDDMKNASSPENRERNKWRPDYYFSRNWELIFFEDLSPQGYYMLPERSRMNLECVQETVKTLARMHSSTFIFESKLNSSKCTTHSKLYKPGNGPYTINDLYPELIFESECNNEEGHPGYKFWKVGIESQLALIDLLPGYTKEEREVLRARFPEILEEVFEMALPSSKYKNVITHGDIWVNNVLFKNGPDNKVEHALYVDFQMTRYSPPAQDLLLILHVIQGTAFRAQHEKNLIELYYNSLDAELSTEGLKIEECLPKNEFEESLKYYKKFAILTNIIYTQQNQTPPEICAEFLATPELYHKVMFEDRSDMLVASYKADKLVREKTDEGMLELALEYGIKLL